MQREAFESEKAKELIAANFEYSADLNHPVSSAAVQISEQAAQQQISRLIEMNKRVKRLLADERRNLHNARQSLAQEIKDKTELSIMLRQCVNEVKREISRRRQHEASNILDLCQKQTSVLLKSSTNEPIHIKDFETADRERALELMLSQERVLELLYAKTFPSEAATNG